MTTKHSCLIRRYALLLLLALTGLACTIFYGRWEAHQLEFTHYNLPQSTLPGAGPLTIALISDIHNHHGMLPCAAKQIEQSKPDLIVITGDLVTAYERFSQSRSIIIALRRLSAVAPTYAILGNHDYEKLDQVNRVYGQAGVTLLRNEGVDWKTPGGATLRLVGLGDWNEGDEAPEHCLAPQGEADGPVLLLSHDPESRHLLQGYAWNLMLSGHTHGGQLGIPFTHTPICFRSDMPAGHYEESGRHHIVSRGMGSIYNMRFFCPPEMITISVGQAPR